MIKGVTYVRAKCSTGLKCSVYETVAYENDSQWYDVRDNKQCYVEEKLGGGTPVVHTVTPILKFPRTEHFVQWNQERN